MRSVEMDQGDTSTAVSGPRTRRRKVGALVAMTGAAAIVASVAWLGSGSAFADDAADSGQPAVTPSAEPAEAAAPAVAPAPAPEPVEAPAPAPAQSAGVDVSRTPDGWYDYTTDPSTIVQPSEEDEAEAANRAVWGQQRQIIATCMADQGYWYAWTFDWNLAVADPDGAGMKTIILSDANANGTPAQQAAELALYGNAGTGDAYRWEDAGCHGYAVHVTGQDDAN